jgi:hypothetical protein
LALTRPEKESSWIWMIVGKWRPLIRKLKDKKHNFLIIH